MKKRILKLIASESGFSLVELLAAVVLLGLITGPFLTLFIQSAKTNHFTEKVSDATYVANSEMEDLYHLSTSYTLDESLNHIIDSQFQVNTQNCGSDHCYTKEANGHFISIELKQMTSPLEDVVVKVYKSSEMGHLEAQMESIYSWKN